ncbi:MAG: DUF1015 domain-containing protein [Thermoplasmata archaeon]|nr:DUF1015 domain-containing protein [Thermoplasmata archaeon]
MVELLPFRAYHPADPAASELISPVYDTLSDAELRRFSRTPHNAAGFVARPSTLTLAEFLQKAPDRLRSAFRAGAYVQDSKAALYVYGIRYSPPPDVLEALPPDSRRSEYLLLGLVGALDLTRTPEDLIARHEDAFPERIEERVRLTEATGMHFAPIMAGYTLPSHAINDLLEKCLGLDRRGMSLEGTAAPLVRATLDGTEHRLWRLEDPDVGGQLARMLAPLRILILDGHHRYGAARTLFHRDRPGSSPLVMLVESRDRALHLLPWHRAVAPGTVSTEALVARAGSRFVSVRPLASAASIPELIEELGRMSRRNFRGFLAVGPAGVWAFRGTDSADGGYDFDLLHGYLTEEFHGDPHDFGVFRSPRQAIEAIQSPSGGWSGGVAFLLPRLREEAIEERAFSSGRVMAHKSTMFIPKVAEGVLFAPTRDLPREGPGR